MFILLNFDAERPSSFLAMKYWLYQVKKLNLIIVARITLINIPAWI